MSDQLPQFEAPPVVETVLSVQFARLPGYSAAHAGWFWKNCLGVEWTTVSEAIRLDDAFERFGDERTWEHSGLRIRPGIESPRIQIVRDDEERMIQLQDSRFIYNWRKRESRYPTYKVLLPEFRQHFAKFVAFVQESGLGALKPNQWEVTYVNHILKEDVWETAGDWAKVFPGLHMPASDVPGQTFESSSGDWHLVVDEHRGRLHVSLRHVKLGSEQGPEGLRLTLTARGPVDEEEGLDLYSGFELGHKSIVISFDAMTSPGAHKLWKKRGS